MKPARMYSIHMRKGHSRECQFSVLGQSLAHVKWFPFHLYSDLCSSLRSTTCTAYQRHLVMNRDHRRQEQDYSSTSSGCYAEENCFFFFFRVQRIFQLAQETINL